MDRFLIGGVCIAAVLLGWWVTQTARDAEYADVLVNGGFETTVRDVGDDGYLDRHQSDDEPAYWRVGRYFDHTKETYWTMDRENVFEGKNSVRIDCGFLYEDVGPIFNSWLTTIDAIPLAGRDVTLRFYARTEGVEGSAAGVIQVYAEGGSRGRRAVASTRDIVGTTGWTEYCTSCHVASDAETIHLMLGLSGKGTVWFDAVELSVGDRCRQDFPDAVYFDPSPPPTPVLESANLTPPESPLPEKPWTVLLYDDADFTGYNIRDAFARKARSTENVNVLILEDPQDGEAVSWYVESGGEGAVLRRLAELGEVNMSSGETLDDFLVFAGNWYPASRRLVMIYDHGHGWWGACRDETNEIEEEDWRKKDWLTPMEMRAALEAQGGADAIMFTAPCLMGALETAYELRNTVPVYVGSQHYSGYALWDAAIQPFIRMLDEKPDVPTDLLGPCALAAVKAGGGMAACPLGATLSSILTSRLDAVAEAVDSLAVKLLACLGTQFDAVAAARTAAQSFGYNEMIDVADFALHCGERIPELAEEAAWVDQAITDAVQGQLVDEEVFTGAHGLHLFFPQPVADHPAESEELSYARTCEIYRAYGLAFLEDTHWDEFLDAFFAEEANRAAESTSAP